MVVDLDTGLTRLATRILRGAVEVYSHNEDEPWLLGYNPVLAAWNSGMLEDLELTRPYQTVTKSGEAARQGNSNADQVTLQRSFYLPQRLPGVRLPSAPELAAYAGSAPYMVKLGEFAQWLGRDGRPVTRECLLHDEDAADAARQLGVRPNVLPFLWEHALVAGWFNLIDGPYGPQSWVVLGPAFYRWADGDVLGTLRIWGVVFASVLARTLEVNADQEPEAARLLNFQGQAVALAVLLFLARRIGLTTGDASDVIQDGAIGDPSARRAKKAWTAWVQEFGDPARPLLRDLAALRAVALPPHGEGLITLSPLAQWALREQFLLEGIDVPVIPVSGELSAADLVELADVVSDAEFRSESDGWLSRRSPGRAARDLLMHGASADAHARLTAVTLVRRLGMAAGGAWAEAMESAPLRGYAKIALSKIAADSPHSELLSLRNLDPDELAGIAADLLYLIGDDDLAPQRAAVRLAEVIPAGEERRFLRLLADSTYPDARWLLELLGRYHPDRDIARHARSAARAAAKHASSAEHEHVANPSGQLPGPVSPPSTGRLRDRALDADLSRPRDGQPLGGNPRTLRAGPTLGRKRAG